MDLDVAGAARMALLVLAATLAGAILGVPASARMRAGGIRTHAMVTVGAALFCLTGRNIGGAPADLVRIIQGVATGIGFVGAATVVKGSGYVLGITTAASVWIAGAVGCEIGLGGALTGIAVAVAVSVLNTALLALQRRFDARALRRMKP
jgi:putative Mg2+ transporter-C (MgtC) family protein